MRTPNRSTVKWILVLILVLTVGTVLHYALPRHDVVRIVGVGERMETMGWNRFFFAATPSGQRDGEMRDVRYIETMREGDSVLVFRNEDTGWGWPPYFKFDAADVQARARDMISATEDHDWVVVRSYGTRNTVLSIYPNILRVTSVAGPDVRIIPWMRITVFMLIVGFASWIWVKLGRGRDAGSDDDALALSERADRQDEAGRGRFGRMWHRLTGQ